MHTIPTKRALQTAGVRAAALAAGANLAIYIGARSAGVDFTVGQGSATSTVGTGHVVMSSIVPVLAATAAAATLRSGRYLRWFRAAAVVIAGASLGGPLSMGVGVGTKLSLAAMHLVVGGSIVALTSHTARRKRPELADAGASEGLAAVA